MENSAKYLNIKVKIAAGLAALVLLSACYNTRYLGEDELLLNRVEIQTDNKELDREEMKSYLRQRENTRILGFFKFHLWLYNISSRKKEEGWLKRTGEKPQVYSELLSQQSREQLTQYLHNKGYYKAGVSMEENENSKQKKINLKYSIQSDEIYKIGDVSHSIAHPELGKLFDEEYSTRFLKPGNNFDLDRLDAERENIVNFYRNKGYYFFSKPMVYIDADTLSASHTAHLNLGIELPTESIRDSSMIFRPYRINRFTWSIIGQDYLQGNDAESRMDTLEYEGNTFIYRNQLQYNPRLFMRLNRMEAGSNFHAGKTEETFTALNRLRQFRFINIYFQQSQQSLDSSLLNCVIDLAPLPRQSLTFDLEGTNTSGNLGVAGNVSFMNRNLLRGAESLQMRVKGAMERQQAIVSNESLDFNTREIGFDLDFSIPKLIGPATLFHSFGNVLPRTLISLGYNFQRRPDYTRTITSLKLGYEWMASENIRHNWNVLDFNMVALSRFDPDFLNSIYDLYIKSSFTDHMIFGTTYSLVYNTQKLRTRNNYYYVRFSGESSGNLLKLASRLSGAEKVTAVDTTGLAPQHYYKFLGSRYAQYLKTDIELRKGYMLDRYNSVVGRFFLGVGVPYGNFDVLPFEKKYFTGGANGIRAWQVRSLGPGTYEAPPRSYPNQSGDIKIEANMEYRFRLVSYLESALFLDGGNIWAINEKDNRPGAQFRLGQFYKQFALGTGIGFRLDFEYFIFRLDLGLKLRDPAQKENNGWIPGSRKLEGDDFNFSFAIGYPF